MLHSVNGVETTFQLEYRSAQKSFISFLLLSQSCIMIPIHSQSKSFNQFFTSESVHSLEQFTSLQRNVRIEIPFRSLMYHRRTSQIVLDEGSQNFQGAICTHIDYWCCQNGHNLFQDKRIKNWINVEHTGGRVIIYHEENFIFIYLIIHFVQNSNLKLKIQYLAPEFITNKIDPS